MAGAQRGRPSTGVREAVLKATAEVLGNSGVVLSTREIARRAGVAESSIFYHFNDRLGLLASFVGQHMTKFADATTVLGRHPASGTLRTDLIGVLTGIEDFYRQIMPIFGALLSDSQLRENLTERQGVAGPHLALGPVADLLRAEQAAGRVRRSLDPNTGALLVIGAAYQRAMHGYLLGEAAEKYLPSVDAIVEGLLPALEP